ncbi:MAG: hypothetical protein DMG30_27585 [Acidobacteria bacterium]|nr:MAG: hypothetical protein DMG30_27585 [Acidobacteriota bacterium]
MVLADPIFDFFPNTDGHLAAVIGFSLRHQPVIIINRSRHSAFYVAYRGRESFSFADQSKIQGLRWFGNVRCRLLRYPAARSAAVAEMRIAS